MQERMRPLIVMSVIGLMIVVAVLTPGCTLQSKPKAEELIKLTKLGGREMVDSLNAGTIDAMICWEPFNAEAIAAGYGYTLMNSSEIWPNHPCCVLAADENWYEKTANADEILKRVALAHLWAQDFIVLNLPLTAANHSTMIENAVNFTTRSAAVCELAMANIKFNPELDPTGIKTYASKLDEFQVFTKSKWDMSGYASTDAYVDDMLDDQYLTWAKQNKNKTPAEVALTTPVTLRFGYLNADLHQLAFWIAWKLEYYSQLGITVDAHAPFGNGGDLMSMGFKTNVIDIGYLGTAPAVIKMINDNDFDSASTTTYKETSIKIIASVNYEGSALVARKDSGITTVKDLKGKTVGYPGANTVQHFLVLMAADTAGIKVQSV